MANHCIKTLASLKKSGAAVKTCPSATLIDLGDGVFCCEFHTKMNALNSELVTFIHDSLDYVGANGVGMVFGNEAAGKRALFSAGADLIEVAKLAGEGKYQAVEQLLENIQSAVQRSRYSDFPVVAAPYGLALGGGCEICIGSDRIVAFSELNIGLVEVGVGLLPSGGGCLNLWKNFIGSPPTCLANISPSEGFRAVFTNIVRATVSKSAVDAIDNGFLCNSDKIITDSSYLIYEAKKEVLKMLKDGYIPPAKKQVSVLGRGRQPIIDDYIERMTVADKLTEYQTYLAGRIGFVISGGDVEKNSKVEEELILNLEKSTFVDLLKEKKTQNRIDHMLKTGKSLKN